MTEEQQQELIEILRHARSELDAHPDDLREQHSEEAERWEAVLAFADTIIHDSSPDLVPESARATALGPLTLMRDDVQQALLSPEQLDTLLDALARFPASRGRDANQAVTEIAERFQRSTSQRLRLLEGDFGDGHEKLKGEISQLSGQIEEASQGFDARVNQLDQRIGEAEAAADQAKASADQLLNEQQERFRTEQGERDEEQRAYREERDRLLTELREQQEQQGQDHLAELETMEQQSAELVRKISTNTTAGHYMKEADKHARKAEIWRVVTVVLGIVGVVVAAIASFAAHPDTAHLIGKLATASGIFVVAGFTGRESRKHNDREEGYRDLQLQLSAFRPLAQDLSDPLAQQELVVLLRKLFGQPYGKLAEEPELPAELRAIDDAGEGGRQAA